MLLPLSAWGTVTNLEDGGIKFLRNASAELQDITFQKAVIVRHFLVDYCVRTHSDVHSASFSIDTMRSYLGTNTAGAWSCTFQCLGCLNAGVTLPLL
jgi:hypothetical protein